MSPSCRKKFLVQKIPRLNQNVFSEKSNVMVKIEMPDDIGIDDNSSPTDSPDFSDVPVKQEDCISVLDSLENDRLYDRGFMKPLLEDFQCQGRDDLTVEATLKYEVVESECCYEETITDQEITNALKNEELFVGEEFKHEEWVPSYDNVDSIDRENNEEIIKKKTPTSGKRKRRRDCDDFSYGLERKSQAPSRSQVVTHNLPVQDPKTCQFQTPRKSSKSKTFLLAKNQPRKGEYRVYDCAHCDYKGRRQAFIEHCRDKHPYLFSKDSIYCSKCGEEFPSKVAMRRHRYVCLPSLICKSCLVEVPTKKAMLKHTQIVHPEKIYLGEGGKILDEVCVMKTLDVLPFGQRYTGIRKFYMEIKSQLIKLYCPKCAVTCDKVISRVAPSCDICKSRLLFQCQKCKGTRNFYSHIWRHLQSKNTYCSIYSSSSFMDHEKSSDVIDQASSNEPKRHDCEICDFKGTTKKKLYEHVLDVHMENGIVRNRCYKYTTCGASNRVGNGRLKRLQELCRISANFPCIFCPTTYSNTKDLSDHIAIMHFDELDGKDIDEFLQEAMDFTRMVIKMNVERLDDNVGNEADKTERKSYYYHSGIKSMLQPVCIECKAEGPHEPEYCGKCQASLNFVCFNCDELFSKYSVAWAHATRMCENRSFTLSVGETNRAPLDTSTADKELLYCDHCSFKNASKSVICNHIKYTHLKSKENRSLFTCRKCYRRFDNAGLLRQHRLRCRSGYHYKCHFCEQTSINFHVIEEHITTTHANRVRCKDTLDNILRQVFESKRERSMKTSHNRFDEFGWRIKRTFSENVKLATFYCPNCNGTVYKNFRYVTDTSRCPKCNCKLHAYCKVCNKGFFYWRQIASHFQNTKCGAAKIGTYDLDHSYCLRQPWPDVTKNSVDEA